MSEPSLHQPAFRDAAKEKGGSPEDPRQGKTRMEAVAERAGSRNVVSPAFTGMSENKKLGTWVDRMVAEAVAKGKPVSQIVSLTPDLASVLLDRNPNNRKISASTVENYAHEIKNGAWVFNGEPIIISDTGELNDGQHRCQAVIDAERAIDALLIFGVKRESRTTLNRGKVRTVGDYLSMEGHAYANVTAGAAALIWQHRNRGFVANGSGNRATKSEVLSTVADNPGIARSVVLTQSKGADAAGGKTVLAFCHFTFTGAGKREDADTFLFGIMSGAGLKAGDPILYARNRLINERGRLKASEKCELLFRAWNAWRRGDRINRLPLQGGLLPVLEA